ncbi:MAG: hypothetical protein Q9160_009348 [Pyrenula sp. 1 TL-2023]
MLTALLAGVASIIFATAGATTVQNAPHDVTTPDASNNAWLNMTLLSPETAGRGCDCPAFGDKCFINVVQPPDADTNPDWQNEIGTAVSISLDEDPLDPTDRCSNGSQLHLPSGAKPGTGTKSAGCSRQRDAGSNAAARSTRLIA